MSSPSRPIPLAGGEGGGWVALKGRLAKGVLPRPSSTVEDKILLHDTDLLVLLWVSISTDN